MDMFADDSDPDKVDHSQNLSGIDKNEASPNQNSEPQDSEKPEDGSDKGGFSLEDVTDGLNDADQDSVKEGEHTDVIEGDHVNVGESKCEEGDDGEEDDEEDDDEEDDEDSDGDDDGEDEEVDEGDWETDDNGEDDDDDDEGEDDDDDDDDETDEDDDDDEVEMIDDATVLAESDSDTEGCENCPICLCKLKNQDIGTPESCDHCFCLECILEWSRNVNTCPVDRQVFHLIFAKHAGEDKVYKRIPVEDRKIEEENEEEESPTYCEICGECNREDRLLLCDGCDLGYHCECLDPPLDTIPVEEWFCPECAELNRPEQRAAETVDDDDEIRFIITENDTTSSTLRPRRMIARTRVSERVRANLEQMRLQRSRRFTRPELTMESDDEEQEEPAAGNSSVPQPSTTRRPTFPKPASGRNYRRKTTKRKTPGKATKRKGTKGKTRKRKTVRKGTTTRKRKVGKRKGKRRRKVKKVVKKEKPVPVVSVKSRLAKSLGLSKPPTGRTIPLQKTPVEKSVDGQRSDFGISPLSILGHKDELIAFQDEEPTTSEAAVQSKPAGTSRYSKSSLQSRFPLFKPKTKRFTAVKPAVSDSASSLDLLGSIMQDQTKLHMDSEKITINRDGSLTEKDIKLKAENNILKSDSNVIMKESAKNKLFSNTESLYSGIDDDDSQDISKDLIKWGKQSSDDVKNEDNSEPVDLFEDKWTLGVMLEDNPSSKIKSKVTDVTKSNPWQNSSKDANSSGTSVKSNVLDDCKFLDLQISRSSRRSSSESKESGEISQENDTIPTIVKNSNEKEFKISKESSFKNNPGSGKKEKVDQNIGKDIDKNDDESGPERSVFKKKGKINISINFRENMFSKDEENVRDHEIGEIRRSDHREKTRNVHRSSHESYSKSESHHRKSSKSDHRKSSSHGRDKEYNYTEENSEDTFDLDYDSYDAGKVPVSEFPKIPKRKKQETDDDVVEVIVIDDSDAQKPEYDSRGSSEKKRRDKNRDEEYDERWRRSERDRGKHKEDYRSSSDYYRKDKDEYSRRDREGRRSKERDRDRDDYRHRHKKDRHRDRSRSHSRERRARDKSRSRSRERVRRSRSRDRRTRSNSRDRDRKRYSRSRSKERSHKKRRSEKSRDRGERVYRSKSPVRDEDIFKTKSPRKDRIEKDNLLYHSMKQKKKLEKAEKYKAEEAGTTDDKNSDDVIMLQDKEDSNVKESDEVEIKETEASVESEKLKTEGESNSEMLEVSKIEVVTGAKRLVEQNESTSSDDPEFKKFKVDNSDSLIVVKDEDAFDQHVEFTEKIDSGGESETRDCANIQVVVGVVDNNMDKEEKLTGITQISEEYDPACPTDDALGQTPTPPPSELGLLPPPPMTDLAPPVGFPAHLLEENVGHRLSPLPGQGLLGEGGPFLVPSGERPTLLQQPQNMGPLPLRFRMFPPGFRPGLPPQQQMIMNPVFMNRQPAFSGFAQLPPGHIQRFGIQVSGPTEVIPIQNRFTVPPSTMPGQPGAIPRHLNGLQNHPGGIQVHPGDLPGQSGGLPPPHAGGIHIHAQHPGGIPGQSGPINGGEFEHLPPDPGAPPPHFPHLLQPPSDLPMGDPRFPIPLGQPNPLLPHLNPLEPPDHGGLPPASLPDGISTNLVPISLSASIPNIPSSLPKVSSSVASVHSKQSEVSPAIHQIQQITKLLSTQHQLALLSKEKDKEESGINSGISQDNWDSKKENSPPVKTLTNKSSEKDVFKVPFPPSVSQNNQKSKSNSAANDNGVNNVLKNKEVDMETTEVIDMDMSSPLDEGNIEIADSPEFDSIIFGYKRDNNSKKDTDCKNAKKDTSDSSDKKNKENISKVRFKDDKSVHSSSSSVTKPKTTENKVKSVKEKTSSRDKDRKSHRDKKHKEHSHKDKRQPSSSEKKFDEIMNELSSQDEIPSSAVELTNKEKYLKKLHLQERVVDEVKVALKPFYSSRKIDKEQYKDILRRAVPKVCHSKSGDINPVKIKSLVEAYVEKLIRNKNKESSGALKSTGERQNIKAS